MAAPPLSPGGRRSRGSIARRTARGRKRRAVPPAGAVPPVSAVPLASAVPPASAPTALQVIERFELSIDIERLIAETDTDGSGKIDYDEFRAMLS